MTQSKLENRSLREKAYCQAGLSFAVSQIGLFLKISNKVRSNNKKLTSTLKIKTDFLQRSHSLEQGVRSIFKFRLKIYFSSFLKPSGRLTGQEMRVRM